MQNIDLKAQKPAKRYAQAFLEIIQDKDVDKILNELNLFLENLYKDEDTKNFFFHPIVSLNDKKEVVKAAYPEFSKETLNLIFLLMDENRLNCLDEIREFVSDGINKQKNILPVEVTLAIDVNDGMKNFIKQRLEAKFNSNVLIDYKKDESIMGGMLIKIKDTLLDLSIKRKLENFKQL